MRPGGRARLATSVYSPLQSRRRPSRSRRKASTAWRIRTAYTWARMARSAPSSFASASVTVIRGRSPAVMSLPQSAAFSATASAPIERSRARSRIRPAIISARTEAGRADTPRTLKRVSPSITTGAVSTSSRSTSAATGVSPCAATIESETGQSASSPGEQRRSGTVLLMELDSSCSLPAHPPGTCAGIGRAASRCTRRRPPPSLQWRPEPGCPRRPSQAACRAIRNAAGRRDRSGHGGSDPARGLTRERTGAGRPGPGRDSDRPRGADYLHTDWERSISMPPVRVPEGDSTSSTWAVTRK